ncbi:MAG: hypothetical protein IH948_00050 [Bacteroidetes bacterium]|nr:hypothetical protein [Bacteroidota bacterium]
MKTIKDIENEQDPDDYGLSLTEKWRLDKINDMLKMQIPEDLKIFLKEIIEDIYSEIDSCNKEGEGEDN